MANGLFRISLHLVTPRNGYVRGDRIRFDAMSARSVSHSSSVLFFFQDLKRLWLCCSCGFVWPKCLINWKRACSVLCSARDAFKARPHTKSFVCSLQQYCEALFLWYSLSILICSTLCKSDPTRSESRHTQSCLPWLCLISSWPATATDCMRFR